MEERDLLAHVTRTIVDKFHPQQAAEKILKAFLVWKGQDLLRTHG